MRKSKKTTDKELALESAITSVSKAHDAVELLQELDKEKTHGAVLRSIDLSLAKCISELDYLDKEHKKNG